jgi:hypothetical protein
VIIHRARTAAGLWLAAVSFAGCAGPSAAPAPSIHLDTGRQPHVVEVRGLPREVLTRLSSNRPSDSEWPALLRVSVQGADASLPPVAGTYAVADGVLRFTPMFPLDPGRQYDVRFDPSRLPAGGSEGWRGAAIAAVVGTPAAVRAPSTVVTHVDPGAEVLPANQLRLYIHFSAPMGLRGGFDHVKLVDDRGDEVVDPFLPIDSDYWNEDRTRYTLFFDPGRVKRGILPNRQMGRALVPGRRYTLVVSPEWRDGQGQPLRSEFRREFGVRPPVEQALSTSAWSIAPAAAGTRDPLTVVFPGPLDRGLLQRAIGVSRAGERVAGNVRIEAADTRWVFVPDAPWSAGEHQLVVLSILEDLAGNRIGRAFEVDEFDRAERSAEPERYTVAFTIRPGT